MLVSPFMLPHVDPAIGALFEKMGLRLPEWPSSENCLGALATEVKRLGWPRRWIDRGLSAYTANQKIKVCHISPEGKDRIRAAQVKRWSRSA